MRKLATALRSGFVLQHYPFMRQQQDALNAKIERENQTRDEPRPKVRFVYPCVPEVRGSGVLGIVESKEQAPCP